MKNAENTRIYGDDASAWWIADKGTVMPVDLAKPGSGWTEAGWLEEGGVEYSQEVKTNGFKAHQGAAQLRQKGTESSRAIKLGALEETAVVLGLVHPGAKFTKSPAGIVKIEVPASINLQDKAFIIDEVDGAYTTRYLIPAGQANLTDAVKYSTEEWTAYIFEITVLGGMVIETNSPGVVAGVTP